MSESSDQKYIQARYFPVADKPFVMKAGFYPWGTDFGNAERDQLYFQKDQYFDEYTRTKEQVDSSQHWVINEHSTHQELHRRALLWILTHLESDFECCLDADFKDQYTSICHHLQQTKLFSSSELSSLYHQISLFVQEDLALLSNQPQSSLIMGEISMPSFWDPKEIKGASFWEIHHHVPKFPRDERNAHRLGDLISQKGPFVRFVWTVANDSRLDHHPQKGRTPWEKDQPLWLRVERQTTVPFEGLGALFLIRTYLYPFKDLSVDQHKILALAIQKMSPEIAKYKGLWAGKEVILDALLTP